MSVVFQVVLEKISVELFKNFPTNLSLHYCRNVTRATCTVLSKLFFSKRAFPSVLHLVLIASLPVLYDTRLVPSFIILWLDQQSFGYVQKKNNVQGLIQN